MNDRQNTVVATTVVSLILVIVYLCPWRVDSGEIQWSPIYQEPITYQKTYDPEYGRKGGSRLASSDAEVDYGLLVLELGAVVAAGGVRYRLVADSSEDQESPQDSGRSD